VEPCFTYTDEYWLSGDGTSKYKEAVAMTRSAAAPINVRFSLSITGFTYTHDSNAALEKKLMNE
jgi:hypothetical protein